MVHLIDGAAVAAPILDAVEGCVETLADGGVRPCLATVLMSDDPADATFVDLKHEACADLGIGRIRREVDPDARADALYATIDDLNADPAVHGVFVQLPLPDHVELPPVRERIDPVKDVDCLHPENLGRLITGDPRYLPATPRAIKRLLASASVETECADVVIVGRSEIVGKPLANVLLQKGPGGNATVTVCHSRTSNLAAKTRKAEVLVAAAGVPELVDGSMLSTGVVVIDVGVNRVPAADGRGYEVVGDVEFESAARKASAITPVPGGVGPMTVAMLLSNVVEAASVQTSTPVDLP